MSDELSAVTVAHDSALLRGALQRSLAANSGAFEAYLADVAKLHERAAKAAHALDHAETRLFERVAQHTAIAAAPHSAALRQFVAAMREIAAARGAAAAQSANNCARVRSFVCVLCVFCVLYVCVCLRVCVMCVLCVL